MSCSGEFVHSDRDLYFYCNVHVWWCCDVSVYPIAVGRCSPTNLSQLLLLNGIQDDLLVRREHFFQHLQRLIPLAHGAPLERPLHRVHKRVLHPPQHLRRVLPRGALLRAELLPAQPAQVVDPSVLVGEPLDLLCEGAPHGIVYGERTGEGVPGDSGLGEELAEDEAVLREG